LIQIMRWTRARSRALTSKYGPANQGSGRPERARAGAGRPHEEYGALLGPIGRTNTVRRIVAGAPPGPDRQRRANTNRPSCFPAARADSTQHMARAQTAPRLPTARLIAGSRIIAGILLRPRRIGKAKPRDRRSTRGGEERRIDGQYRKMSSGGRHVAIGRTRTAIAKEGGRPEAEIQVVVDPIRWMQFSMILMDSTPRMLFTTDPTPEHAGAADRMRDHRNHKSTVLAASDRSLFPIPWANIRGL
jgi:hypothetical protein